MQCASFVRQYARSIISSLLLLVTASAAFATDVYSGGILSIPTMTIGSVTYSGLVVVPGPIISGPSGATGNGAVDTYDPLSGQLTIPNVIVGSSTYHNVIVSVASVTTIGGVAGADIYSAPDLTIPSVQVGAQIYNNVTVTVTLANVQHIGGGMPGNVRDQYSGGILTIPAVSVSGHVFTNVEVTVASIVTVGGIDVPNLVGQTQATATTLLAAAHLIVGTVTTASSSTVPSGDVISQVPAAGQDASLGSAVNIAISTGSGGGTGGTGTGIGWFPFYATPVPETTGGQTGLFVLPANPLEATAANIKWIIPDTQVQGIGLAFVFQSGNAGIGFWPYAGFYAALDSNNIVEIYEVNLTNASTTAPTAVPIGNFKAKNVTSLDAICDYTVAQTNILDATSWFAVVHIAGGSGFCGVDTSTGDSWVLVTATTTTTLSITTTQFDQFYNPSGLLTGIVLNDPATNNIYLYANDSFTAPTKLFTGATTDNTVHSQTVAGSGGFLGQGTVEFRQLGNGTSSTVYRLDYTGASSFKAVPSYNPNPNSDYLSTDSIYTGTQTDGVNFYFTDTDYAGETSATVTLYQETIGGTGSTPGAPIALFTQTFNPATSTGFAPLGSNGSVVVLATTNTGVSPNTSVLGTVPVGVAHTAAQTVIGPASFTGTIDSTQMLGGSGGNYAHSSIFINLNCPTCATPTRPDTTGILDPSGTILETLTPDSLFLLQDGFASNTALQIKGVTDTSGTTEGGGMLYVLPTADNSSSFSGLPFTTCTAFAGTACSATGSYVVPAHVGVLGIVGISTNFAAGIMRTNDVLSGMIANVGQEQIGTISLSNTSIDIGF
jgi:hypothetical protein